MSEERKRVKILDVLVDVLTMDLAVNRIELWINEKKKKYIKFKEPKIIKKELFNDDCYDLGELYSQIKNCHDRDPYNEMEVSFTSKLEF